MWLPELSTRLYIGVTTLYGSGAPAKTNGLCFGDVFPAPAAQTHIDFLWILLRMIYGEQEKLI